MGVIGQTKPESNGRADRNLREKNNISLFSYQAGKGDLSKTSLLFLMDLPLSSVKDDGSVGNKQKDKRITCYSYDSNREYPDNVKCPDSDSCCESIEQCRPDRLCTSKDDPKTLIRAPCAYKPWTNSCAQVCLYDNKESLILPRAVVCENPGPANGSYCCDDNRTCCIDKAGFFLSSDGILVGRANQTEDDPTLTPRPIGIPASSLISMGSSATAGSSPVRLPGDEKAGLSTAAKAGIGVGVAVAVLLAVIAGTLLFLRRKRRNKRTAKGAVPGDSNEEQDQVPLPEQDSEKQLEQPQRIAHENAHELMGDGGTSELPPSEVSTPTYMKEQAERHMEQMEQQMERHMEQQGEQQREQRMAAIELPADPPSEKHRYG
ncbi:uncharacterized protein GIQ15_05076 [Arthroderma uncinatum]|uniref:uncharacterized protein n=1 Tax=Arthroderma uncinatum TaxID=74035 RepID=UPI00144A6343|nr:uncharacterized protein GIQ15_05076 [Arthroderma uncinatum]KAF3482317.1 hypothetical protein GIQ15_05076 [Arthroderma uncinatum]